MRTRKPKPIPNNRKGLRPVLVQEQGSLIRICPVGEPEPGVYALDPSKHFMDLGSVMKGTQVKLGLFQTIWRGTSLSGKKTSGGTKADAIALMLDADHFYEISVDDTIPSLF